MLSNPNRTLVQQFAQSTAKRSAKTMSNFLESLIVTCLQAVAASNEEIRQIQRRGPAAYQTSLKDDADPRTCLTIADQTAQATILSFLRARFPNLTIVAEEEEQEEASPARAISSDGAKSSDHLAAFAKDLPAEYADVTAEAVTVYVDPIDGTREFVEGRLGGCQTLVGIAWHGRPIIGIIGLPFHEDRIGHVPSPPSQASGMLFCAIVGKGIYPRVQAAEGSTFCRDPCGDAPILAVSSSIAKGEEMLGDIPGGIGIPRKLHVGACGNKALHVVTGAADGALFNLRTSRWDTCATAAFITAIGGSCMTLGGFPICHGRVDSQTHFSAAAAHSQPFPCQQRRGGVEVDTANPFGVLLLGPSLDAQKIASLLRGLPGPLALFQSTGLVYEGRPLAVDIVRDIDGEPFTKEMLAEALGVRKEELEGFTAAEEESVRYKQSHACRVKLTYTAQTSNGEPDGKQAERVESFFYKRSVFRELPNALKKAKEAPFKLARDVRSMDVEAAVLRNPLLLEFSKASNVGVPVAFFSQRFVVEQAPLESRFVCMLRDFAPRHGWRQSPDLPPNKMRLGLQALAQWHAFFWIGDGSSNASRRIPGVWPIGSYLQPSHQPEGQCEAISAAWKRFMGLFKDPLLSAELSGSSVNSLGDRLQRRAAEIAGQIHVESGAYMTLIHGDAKPSNMFFKDGSDEVAMIDFQWTGKGLPGTDVAYCIAAGVSRESAEEKDVAGLLERCIEEYWKAFVAALVRFGVVGNEKEAEHALPLEELRKQVRLAMLDLGRVVICDHWKPVTPDVLTSREGHLVYNAYNKSVAAAMWMVRVLLHLLHDE